MAIQQLMIAQNINSGGSGGLPPSTYAGLTYWLDADNSPMYKSSSTSGGASGDGDVIARIDSANSIARTLAGGTITTLRDVDKFGVNGAVVYTGTPPAFTVYTKPSGTSSPSVSSTIANMFTTTNALIIWAGIVTDAGADQGAGLRYQNTKIFADNAGYVGLVVSKSGGNAVFWAYNYDNTNGERSASATVPLGQACVIAMQHRSNQVRICLNGGTWTQVASLATGSTTGTPIALDAPSLQGSTGQLFTYNASRTDAEVLELMKWAGTKVGVTI